MSNYIVKNYAGSGVDKNLTEIFQPISAAPGATGTMFKSVGTDLNNIFAQWTSGYTASPTSYIVKNYNGPNVDKDLSDIFQPLNPWSALGSGCSDTVYSIAIDSVNNVVYVGGNFLTAGGIPANHIAKWTPLTNSWSALGLGCSGTVYTIAIDSVNNVVYVGGTFVTAGGITVNNIAKWTTLTNSWSELGTYPNVGVIQSPGISAVYSIKINSYGDVYVGGNFFKAGASVINFIAIWNQIPNDWSSPGIGYSGGITKSIAFDVNNNAYAGTTTGSSERLYIFTYMTSSWGSSITPLYYIATVTINATDIYVGGAPIVFSTTSMMYKSNISSISWSEYITSTNRINNTGLNTVNTIITDSSNNVYVGGNFTTAGSLPVTVNFITKSDNTSWYNLGPTPVGTNDIVNTIAIYPTGIIYVGGNFTTAGGGILASKIAKYSP
jgi:hypothetical protein